MRYLSSKHATERLAERAAGGKVFDPRIRRFVDVRSLGLCDQYSLIKSHLYRSHLLPPIAWGLFREISYRQFDLVQNARIVRFDDYVYILRPDKDEPDTWYAATMVVPTEKQAKILVISPHELYVVTRQSIYSSLVRQAQGLELAKRGFELEDAVRRAVHFGVMTTRERALPSISEEDQPSPGVTCTWYAGPLRWTWGEEGNERTLIVGARFSNEFTQVVSATILERAFDPAQWRDESRELRIYDEMQAVPEVASQAMPEVAPQAVPEEASNGARAAQLLVHTIPLPIEGVRMHSGKIMNTLRGIDLTDGQRRSIMNRAARNIKEVPLGAMLEVFGRWYAVSFAKSISDAKIFAAPVRVDLVPDVKSLVVIALPEPDGEPWRCMRAVLTTLEVGSLLACEGCVPRVAQDEAEIPTAQGSVRVQAGRLAELLGLIEGEQPQRLIEYLREDGERMEPLSAWGLYDLLGLADETRCAGCALALDGRSPIGTGVLALGFERRGDGWMFTRAKCLQRTLDGQHVLAMPEQSSVHVS